MKADCRVDFGMNTRGNKEKIGREERLSTWRGTTSTLSARSKFFFKIQFWRGSFPAVQLKSFSTWPCPPPRGSSRCRPLFSLTRLVSLSLRTAIKFSTGMHLTPLDSKIATLNEIEIKIIIFSLSGALHHTCIDLARVSYSWSYPNRHRVWFTHRFSPVATTMCLAFYSWLFSIILFTLVRKFIHTKRDSKSIIGLMRYVKPPCRHHTMAQQLSWVRHHPNNFRIEAHPSPSSKGMWNGSSIIMACGDRLMSRRWIS